MEYLLKVDACICRHSHKPYHRVLKNPKKKGSYFHSVNAASVGNPKDGNPKSYYAILTIDKSSNLSKKEGAQVEFVRVTYDIEKTAEAIEESPLLSSIAYRRML